MTKSTITRERLEWLSNISCRDDIEDIGGDEIRELASMALAAMDSEPVAVVPEDVRQELSKMDDEIIAELDAEESGSRATMDSEPVAIVEPSDYVTAAQLVGEESLRKAVRELYEGALRIGDKLYRHAQPVLEIESEPVFTLEVASADYKGQKLGNHFGFITLDAARGLKEGNYQLYTAQLAPVVPDGYVMVPKEPTKEMIDAGWLHYMATKNPSSKGTYKAMLAAAPQEVPDGK